MIITINDFILPCNAARAFVGAVSAISRRGEENDKYSSALAIIPFLPGNIAYAFVMRSAPGSSRGPKKKRIRR